MHSTAATDRQLQYIASLVSRDFYAALPLLQAIYDAHSGADGWQVTKSGYAKHVLRKLDREQASQLIDDLNAL